MRGVLAAVAIGSVLVAGMLAPTAWANANDDAYFADIAATFGVFGPDCLADMDADDAELLRDAAISEAHRFCDELRDGSSVDTLAEGVFQKALRQVRTALNDPDFPEDDLLQSRDQLRQEIQIAQKHYCPETAK